MTYPPVPAHAAHAPNQPTLTIMDVITLPELIHAELKILVGPDRLDTPVRWVHIAESQRVGTLLNGGELLLTTGTGWGETTQERRTLITSFAAAGAAALLVELGSRWREIPLDVVTTCRMVELPLLVVHNEIRFVAITEAIHEKILRLHLQQISALQDVTESFSTLIYNGAPTEQLVTHTSRLLRCPVVLEDINHHMVCYSEGHHKPSDLLRNWNDTSAERTRRLGGYGTVLSPLTGADGWSFIDVQARGTVWGRLLYQGTSHNPAGGSSILRQAAMALAVERLSSPNPHSWTDLLERNAISLLLGTRFTTAEGAGQVLNAAGFATTDTTLYGIEFAHTTTPLTPELVRAAINTTLPRTPTLVAASPINPGRIICALNTSSKMGDITRALEKIGTALLEHTGPGLRIIVSKPCAETTELAAAIRHIQKLNLSFDTGALHIIPLSRTPIDSLLYTLKDDVRVQDFVASTLDPILLYDARHHGDLLHTLRAVLRHPGSRTAAAEELHLSRTALYSRISTIERLLGVDLADGDAQFSLGLALRAHEPGK